MPLSWPKNRRAKERATNGVLAAGRFDDEKLQRSLMLLPAQRTYLEVFRKFASTAGLNEFDQKAGSPIFQKVEELRSAVLAKGMAGGFGIAPETWFSASTDKINAMKEVEDLLAKEILSTAGSLAHQAKMELVMSLIMSFVLVILSFTLGFSIMLGITKPLSRMLHMLKDIAEGEGDLTRRLKVDRKDELGEVSLWFNRFVDNVHRPCRRVAEGADRVPFDLLGDVEQHVDLALLRRPSTMRSMTRHIHPAPSRQGVHWPQLSCL